MKCITLPLVLVAVLALSACGSSMTFNSDFDDSVDFSTWSTFRYAVSDELNPGDLLQTNPFAGKRARAAIEEGLQAKGYVMVESDDPDFVVLAHVGSKEKVSVSSYSTSYGGYYGGWYDPWWGPYGTNTSVSYYEEGTMVLDIVDVKRKELVWRGMATATLASNPSGEQVEKNIRKAVDGLLMRFPPQ